ncbi:little elongation complex subunit 2 isoform X2 [Rhinatrema bivittatum]|uniref:little elongation complex subunit 2 isoform X2 n=1 Tax=Rhinatrema bivittatum TaxID=194408 RepID=UPI0011269E9C|nr:little elongation complex subunit 2 isoform X2 [Rhinatrema bivittatum]
MEGSEWPGTGGSSPTPAPLGQRDVSPKNGSEVFFSRSIYEKYSMSPTLLELWHLANRPTELKKDVPVKHLEEEKGPNSQPAAAVEEDGKPFPEPKIPYPYFSSLMEKEQKLYVHFLMKYANNKKYIPLGDDKEYSYFMNLKSAVSGEVAEFLKYAQNAARSCAEDYNVIPADGCRYTEELLNACQRYVKNYPEFYTLSEITTIMGGKFSTDLTLKLEKCLLKLGHARFVKASFLFMPTQIQLSIDYTTVSTFSSSEKRAAEQHKDIQSDPNIEKLALKYCPQIVLTAQALFALLNNHGLNYKEQWEIPVCVKMLPVKDSKPMKMVYIDSPLPKKEMTVREKNQTFHEVALDLLMSKKPFVSLTAIMLDKWVSEYKAEGHIDEGRKRQESEKSVDNDLDFENDVTELETFGTISDSSRKLNIAASVERQQNLTTILSEKLRVEKQVSSDISTKAEEARKKELSACCEILEQSSATSPGSGTNLLSASLFKGLESTDTAEGDSFETETDADDKLVSSEGLNASRKTDNTKQAMCSQTPHQKITSCSSDTDEEKLVIVTGSEKSNSCNTAKLFSPPSPVMDTPRSPSPVQIPRTGQVHACLSLEQKKSAVRNPSKRLCKEFDPVGHILKMQTELLKPSARKPQEQSVGNVDKSTNLSHTPAVPLLAKPCVTLPSEPGHNAAEGTSCLPGTAWASQLLGAQTCFLPSELRFLVEDESEYIAPEEGNLVYKLFSLDDMLLMIRSSVHKAETKPRNRKKCIRKFPIYVLPKVEYQACYGVEALTESEICRLWTESLLHSNSYFYIGHIDAITSKLFLLEEISVEGIKEKFGTFKPINSLNILRNILKKVSGLQEGSYLLNHAAGDSSVSIYKSYLGKVTRTAYNLHQAHSCLPQVPSTLSVPWVPLDPTLVLPYHLTHGRIPCTFPPKPRDFIGRKKVGVVGTRRSAPGQSKSVSKETKSTVLPTQPVATEGVASKKKKQNKGKRASRWQKWNAKKQQRQAQAVQK